MRTKTMPTTFRDPDYLLGRRFMTDFTVIAVSGGAEAGEPTATLALLGTRYVISLEELGTIIESGFVVETDGRTGES